MPKYRDNTTGEVRELLIGTTPNYMVFDEMGRIVGLFTRSQLEKRFSPVQEGE